MKRESHSFFASARIMANALRINLKCMSAVSLCISALGFVMAFWPTLIARLFAALTDTIQSLFTGKDVLVPGLWLICALVAAYLFQVIYDYLNEVCMERDMHRITRHIKESVMHCAGTVQYRFINNDENFRDKMSFTEMFGGAEVAKSVQQVVVTMQMLLSVISIAVVLGTVNGWIVVALFVATIPSICISASQQDTEYKSKMKHLKSSAMSVHLFYMATGANEHCKSLLDLRFNNFFPWIRNRWQTVSNEYLSEKRRLTTKFLLLNILADLLRNGVYIVILVFTARNIFSNPLLGLGTFTLVLTLSQQIQKKLTHLFGSVTTFLATVHYMEDYLDLLNTPTEPMESQAIDFEKVEVVFDHVSFNYPGKKDPALRDLSVTIHPGEKIAIVGENGSGKSTFVNLICGMYEPTQGEVRINAHKVMSALQSVRKAIAFVPQNFGRYEATLRENISIADPDANLPDSELYQFATNMDAREIIDQQPKKLDEIIGSFSETGSNLSGGQWQKLALMRALYRKNAKIVILDEPTAALDPEAEANLYRNFRQLTGNKTTISISHRLGICTQMDRVLVFQDGCLVEDGTHATLLAKQGVYARLYNTQAQWYR